MERLKRRSLNRARMPTVAAWVDAVRAAFGECWVAYARENGFELETEAHRKEREAIRRGERLVIAGPLRGDEFAGGKAKPPEPSDEAP